jgi:hypothetical protein
MMLKDRAKNSRNNGNFPDDGKFQILSRASGLGKNMPHVRRG